jgi:hypothetical protein
LLARGNAPQLRHNQFSIVPDRYSMMPHASHVTPAVGV